MSATAYLGADALLPALDTAAVVVVTGRVADPSLFLAPLAHRLGWRPGDVPAAAAGTLVGHLLACAGQLTGGYFADPGHSDVERPADLGFPWAKVRADGSAVFGKPAGSGGRLDRHTVRQQLLYEVTDPTAYRTPDVVLDLGGVRVTDEGPDRVRVDGAAGRARPDELKVSVGYRAGHRVEAEISYVGPNAAARSRVGRRHRRRTGPRARRRPADRGPRRRRRLPSAARGAGHGPGRAGRARARGRVALHERSGRWRWLPLPGRRGRRRAVDTGPALGGRAAGDAAGGPTCGCMRSPGAGPGTRAPSRR
ncbi:acyclic terpene utilization AtuA family protein [Pseudonocardia sp. NPDC046786]|uniref:acyclic terpene utilization AtuA family protein n=1 Tax=Pseudonocardia sp. NPDC046786 TaxID=3155471 RepID=UPI0033FA8727